ncbi:unnamed protein product [Heligmosomoides polygyrus]|uniref:PTS EIIA type-2 domain-containing protein n=1 Tax=Heligmosomoides polygyrus TaxID=6339 RepID=A0A183G577_HELPZ|nr:unnamed protein product [Heligmosomoides polygyrus]
MLCLIRHVCDKTSVSILHKDKVYLSPGVPAIERDEVGIAYLCCLLIKQAPKLFLGLIRAASLRSIRREEVIESLLRDDNDLHQSIVKALNAYNRVTKSFGDDYSDTTGGPHIEQP